MRNWLNKRKPVRPLADEAVHIKSFKENQRDEEAFDYRLRGLRNVALEQIVGSVGRYLDFDSKFRLNQDLPQDRLENIKAALAKGKQFPPVKLYQIKDEYYVLDGNHRISAAKELGFEDIRADIVEFIPARKDFENFLYRERADFYDRTALSYDLPLTETGQYPRLIEQISVHQRFLESTGKKPLEFEQAADDWYKTIYTPLATVLKQEGLLDHFPGRTLADFYTYISFHQWSGDQAKNMEAFRNNMTDKWKTGYPDMLRTITAFILLNVATKKENSIIEKLFSLDEVNEVHSVHGSVDILVKIILTRDLLSSDAEIIGGFVQKKIRQISGIISSQTLIPSISKTKTGS